LPVFSRPLRGRAIKWPAEDALTAEISAFKATRDHTGAEPEKIVTTASPAFDPVRPRPAWLGYAPRANTWHF
jgi:hypothetical protein